MNHNQSERCANTEALNRYEKEQEQYELQEEQQLEEMHNDLIDQVNELAHSFKVFCRNSDTDRLVLKADLLEWLSELI